MVTRSAGVLMSISSLPGPFGIGTFGSAAKKFIDLIKQMGFTTWQVLPFNPLDIGNSPYGSPSAFAGNPLYIDPIGIKDLNLLNDEEMNAFIYGGSPFTADYDFAKANNEKMLRLAFLRIGDTLLNEIKNFYNKSEWVRTYALYLCLKEKNLFTPWYEWEDKDKHFETASKRYDFKNDSIRFYAFQQYIFKIQWDEILSYSEQSGITIMGDMPIYVSLDSADVWSNPEMFCLDKNLAPTKVAGVPPDLFSSEGQLWGNLIYDWDFAEQDGYSWWIKRLSRAFEIYHKVRIDHFRGFASYWSVPPHAKSAKLGKWEKGPGSKLFRALAHHFPVSNIIAEDLGSYGEDVVSLLKETGIDGMRVIQFGFSDGSDSTHLPHNYPAGSVAYLGTHDNNTLLGWLWELTEEERQRVLRYCGFKGDNWGEGGYYSPSCRAIIETVWKSAANTTIIAFQDLCGFGSDARMNIPGVPKLNWRFRTTYETMNQINVDYFHELNKTFFR